MLHIKKTTITMGLALFAAIILTNGSAYAQDPMNKLGRGAANTLTGWVEIPKTVYSTGSETSFLNGWTVGLVHGFGKALVRTGAGLVEIVTFPFPVPQNYEPVIQPEYVF